MPSRSTCKAVSKLSRTAERNASDSTKPPTARPSEVHTAAAKISRAAREFALSGILARSRRIVEAIAKATHRLNEIGLELLAQPADEDFDGCLLYTSPSPRD